MKKRKILFLIVVLFLITGCTKQLKDVDGKIVKNEETGQVLPSNIMCQPTDKDIIKLYEDTKNAQEEKLARDLKNGKITKKEYNKKMDNLLDINDLPKCSKFTVASGGYEGLWMTIFIKPLTWFLIKLGQLLNNYGLAIIFATLLIRIILYPITRKTLKQSEMMKQVQPEIQKIEKKYKDKNDQQSMAMKSQELMAIYKKYNINPMSGCLFSFLQIPLFFAFYEALYRLPVLFEDNFLIYNMATTPMAALTKGQYLYLILPAFVALVTYFSFKANKNSGAGGQEKQMKTMMNVMLVIIVFTSFQMSTAIILYWIANSGFTILQNQIVKRSKK
ncbi:MAG: YidC/Oxa1 family membrane protein insertase [Bacilli bacterium]|nr:YidC/Oxa1 family membrane protein insertase [Bacilli bacterium]